MRDRPNLVLRAATGAGKTTRVPPAVLEGIDARGSSDRGRLVMLEPRRVAARAAARRIAEEQGWKLGKEVGYQVRFDRVASESTRILVVTEGILVQMLQRDPFLEQVNALVFDEFHERNLHSDLSFAMARKVQREVREDLGIVVMSATLDPDPLVRFLGGESHCAHLESEGRLFPVRLEHLPRPDARALPTLVREGVDRALAESDGDLLVFLPGVGEIRRCQEVLEPVAARRNLSITPLYGDLPSQQQDAALCRGSRRKVVLATNVAETSVTVDGVTAVVDSGLARTLRFDPGLGLDRLELGRISLASAEQRRGRAGRQAPGLCLRLWSEHEERGFPEREVPEIQRVDLARTVLELLAWGEADPAAFPWFEPPEGASLERASRLLEDLGALDAGGLTPLGTRLARLALHPRLARLLVEGARRRVLDDAALLAALVSERDVVFRPVGHRRVVAMASAASDPLDRLDAVRQLEASGYGECALGPVDPGRSRHVLRVADQLRRAARAASGEPDLGGRSASPEGGREDASAASAEAALLACMLAAYPDRVARRREQGSRRAVMVGGRGVRLAEMSAVHEPELFVCVELDAGQRRQRGESLVRQASGVEEAWLAPIHETDEAVFDGERRRVVGRRLRRYRDLVLSEAEIDPGAESAEKVLARAAAEHLGDALDLESPSVAGWLGRLRSLRQWMPELGLPAFDDAELRRLLPMLVAGKRSFQELR
ncbi:MAG: DEAD/DEAH box helicase, partial [Holophagales bacterium]|nr:DEAD/DEAH box helicase [Holophagales bacterium]